ncbi:hypothetical protein J6590_011305 [Homalodisca vitripennis]|nr:hypothetical protein J6590_011305 [Homalodisca vitripennis]
MNHICNNDQFLVSGGSPVPAICGINSGNHMYVDAGLGTSPVTLTVVTSGPAMSRHWKIKVCQIPCSSSYKGRWSPVALPCPATGRSKSARYLAAHLIKWSPVALPCPATGRSKSARYLAAHLIKWSPVALPCPATGRSKFARYLAVHLIKVEYSMLLQLTELTTRREMLGYEDSGNKAEGFPTDLMKAVHCLELIRTCLVTTIVLLVGYSWANERTPRMSITIAEDGCLQYFTGVSGQIKSFNYEPLTGLHLSNQDYSICIRMERNFCGIQYMQCPDEGRKSKNFGTYLVPPPPDFSMEHVKVSPYPNVSVNNRTHSFTLTGNTLGQNAVTSMIGGVGPNSCNTDWLIIPCTSNVGRVPSSTSTGCVDRLCGGTLNSEVSTFPATVYSTVKPFRIVFHTNNVEAPNDVGNRGFCLDYVQQPCTNAPNPL